VTAWIIINRTDPDLGWNAANQTWEADDYDTFSDDEKENSQDPALMPADGKWIPVPWNTA
jgi:hypothetical protein